MPSAVREISRKAKRLLQLVIALIFLLLIITAIYCKSIMPLFVAFPLSFAFIPFRTSRRNIQQRNARIAKRMALTDDQLFRIRYRAVGIDKESISLARQAIAYAADIPFPDRLLPKDRLFGDLWPFRVDNLGKEGILTELEQLLNIDLSEEKESFFWHMTLDEMTVDDVIRYVWLLRSRSGFQGLHGEARRMGIKDPIEAMKQILRTGSEKK